ncbi:tetrahydromethanopterin S-methyltransferase subunit B [Methanobrevibacter cuticularis]|uniref:Tetrahydromethanopterin S-methyltransferase subunit B n=1 Tax=Methanobrevibacter cuticularis TaxID=47311 RepID=A0A166F2L0_9EURY|nr:tetrahydromethanopterin S-methyltransferase subunit B [Methanobrevibacter cuticularis]KZX17251.1 tetrahydromethanopterin S-methyltransferase subunit B [Methanobrevibacter cuticularis]
MEMLPLIKIVPEYNLTLDPSTGIIGAALGREVLVLTMDDVIKEIDVLESAADDLLDSLNPNTVSEGAYPGREGVYATAGMLTNMVYGFVIGLFVLIAAIPLLASLGVL